MPNIKSAKKRVLVIEKKTLENRMVKSAIKTELKKFDQAAAKGVYHKNTVSRKKSQLSKALAALA